MGQLIVEISPHQTVAAFCENFAMYAELLCMSLGNVTDGERAWKARTLSVNKQLGLGGYAYAA